MDNATLDLDQLVTAAVRAELGWQRMSQSALAEALGETDNWVSRRLRDEVPITVKELSRIAAVLKVSVMDLMQKKHEEMDRLGMDRGLAPSLGGRTEALEPKVPRQQRARNVCAECPGPVGCTCDQPGAEQLEI